MARGSDTGRGGGAERSGEGGASAHRPLPGLRPLLWAALAAALAVVIVTGLLSFLERRAERRSVAPPSLGETPDFELVGHQGRAVSRDDLLGTPWVADLIFTRCRLSCPLMTERMKELRRRLPVASEVRLVSVTVDPEHDTPEVLAAYAEEHGIEGPDWLFLTGPKERVYRLAREGFRLGVDEAPPEEMVSPEEPILHSTRFVLVDAGGRIRGYYEALEAGGLDRLLRDLAGLEAEG